MKNIYLSTLILGSLLAACSAPPPNDLSVKKQQLDSAKNALSKLKQTIASLEKEIQAADPDAFKNTNAVLVSTVTLDKKPFEHFIDVRGTVESRRNVSLSAQLGGEIQRVHVSEGQRVSKGQLLVSLNADVLRSGIEEVKTSLDLANTIFNKQENLWKQKIGTELQYLQAKNTKESLEKRLVGLNAQLDQTLVRAPFNGTIDKVDALEGQMASPGFPLVRMVSQDDMYIKADVSEEFVGALRPGDKVQAYFPVQKKTVSSTIASVGQVINPENRTFAIEIRLPANLGVNPNQVSVVSLRNYVNNNAYAVPTKYIQRDNKGQFVFITEVAEGVFKAKKAYIRIGQSYQGITEVLEGLTGAETIVGEGFREVTEGAEVTLAVTNETKVASK